MIYLLIILPFTVGLLFFLMRGKTRKFTGYLALLVTLINLAYVITIFKKRISTSIPWTGFGIDLSIRLDNFSSFIILAVAVLCVLITLYSTTFIEG